jgi:hypothetical protein
LETTQLHKKNEEDSKQKITSLWLSLNLNYAVFLYKIKINKKRGLKHLRHIIEEALDDIDNWEPEEHT